MKHLILALPGAVVLCVVAAFTAPLILAFLDWASKSIHILP